jgi:translation initiation factor 1
MGKKSKKNRIGVVYSTNPDYDYNYDERSEESLEPQEQNLRVMHDRKQRKGKTVTLVTGYIGPDEDLKDLAKILKSKCGVGGTAKDGEIIIQGAFKDKIKDILLAEGYSQTKTSGG